MMKETKFLAFEGGGGKGIIYLGAIRALELNNNLPMHSQWLGLSDSVARSYNWVGF